MGLRASRCAAKDAQEHFRVDTEDPNQFLDLLKKHHYDVWERSFNSNWLICIPQSVSLSRRIRREDIETHVLQPGRNQGDYISLNKKRIGVVGNKLCTREGFHTHRRVHIMCTEDLVHPNDANKSVMVLHISRPLSGGVEAPSALEEMDKCTLKRYTAILRAFPENEMIFRELDEFIERVHSSARRGEFSKVKPNLESVIRKQWERSVDALFEAKSFESGSDCTVTMRRRHLIQIQQAVESYIMAGTHECIFSWLQRTMQQEDKTLSSVLHRMRAHTQADLHMKPAFQCPAGEAVNILAKLPSLSTPLEKLLCIKDTAAALSSAVEQNLDSHYHDKGAYQLTTDDLLDELLYLLLEHRVSNLWTEMTYMKRFHFINISSTVLGYNLANLEVAIGWFAAFDRGTSEDASHDRSSFASDGSFADCTRPQLLKQSCGQPMCLIANETNTREARAFYLEEEKHQHDLPLCGNEIVVFALRSTTGHDTRTKDGVSDSGLRYHLAQTTSPSLQPSAGPSDRDSIHGPLSALACGPQYYAAISEADGNLYMWGLADGADSGRLGLGPGCPSQVTVPTLVPTFNLCSMIVLEVACGAHHAHAIVFMSQPTPHTQTCSVGGQNLGQAWSRNNKASNERPLAAEFSASSGVDKGKRRLFGWGRNECGQLGMGLAHGSSGEQYNSPQLVKALHDTDIRHVACGSQHSLAVSATGVVWSWGRYKCGRLGRAVSDDEECVDGTGKHAATPSYLPGVVPIGPQRSASNNKKRQPIAETVFKAVESIATGWSHSLAVTKDGALYTWGNGEDGRLGLGSHSDHWRPSLVLAMRGETLGVVQAAGGYAHTLILTRTGLVFACGHNKFGQLGVGQLTASVGVEPSVPTAMAMATLGVGDSTFSRAKAAEVLLVPRRVHVGDVRVRYVGCGENHSVACTEDGKVYRWGLDVVGQGGQHDEPAELEEGRGALVATGASAIMLRRCPNRAS